MGNRTCSEPTCERTHRARGWCKEHYDQQRDRGLLIKLIRPDLQERILSRVDIRDEGYKTPCWISNRAAQPNGYTKIGINGVTWLTHRAAYTAFVGPIPDGLELDHLCRNVACCNPGHLEPVTSSVNVERRAILVTHCKRGHPLSGANLYLRPDRKGRMCRICRSAAQRATA
jgi:hypothetical protein